LIVGALNFRSNEEFQRAKEEADKAAKEVERYKEIARKSGF
jgi:hypothetical protein